MAQEYRSSPLKFPLEETVLFHKGEEIEELYSLSLEPNVSITDLEHFISIRGSLEMSGEYKKTDSSERTDEELSYPERKYATVSESRNEGISYFEHRFPVDITVPKERVHNPEELSIQIDAFDYTMPANNCLVITTELSVLGVYPEEQDNHSHEDASSNEANFDEWNPRDFSLEDTIVPLLDDFEDEDDEALTFSAEATKQEERETDEDHEFQIPVQVVYNTDDGLSEKQPNEFVQEREEVEVQSETHSLHQEESSPEVVLASDYRAEETKDEGENLQETFVASSEELEETVEDDYDETNREEQFVSATAEDTAEEDSEEDDQVVDLTQARTEKSIKYSSKSTDEDEKPAISLTDFFAHKEENRTAKMRVYFVQEDDTLNLIAERYEINVSQLLRANDLEPNQDLQEGQILYIPT